MIETPRAKDGRAPDIFTRGGWVPMRQHREDEAIDFAIVGAGAGGATLAAKLAEAGFSVVAFEAGPYWRPLEDFASDEAEQHKLYWTDKRITGGDDPIELGGNNSGRGVGGSTVHFSMISLRFRPDWFKCRTKLGYGLDWPISFEEIRPYYVEAERALAVSGPVHYPWGPFRGPYPYRPHEVNAPGLVLARGAEALGVKWAATPIATVSAPRGKSSPCMYRGYCNFGCSTNAKQSALVVWAQRAVAAGAEVRDLAMVTRIEDLYKTIRAIDPKHIVLLPGYYGDIGVYGDPTAKGFTNVAFQLHPYPGLFGDRPNDTPYMVHRDWLRCGPTGTTGVCAYDKQVSALKIPLLMGEFQP